MTSVDQDFRQGIVEWLVSDPWWLGPQLEGLKACGMGRLAQGWRLCFQGGSITWLANWC